MDQTTKNQYPCSTGFWIHDQKNNNENESNFFVKDKNNFNLNIVQNGLKIIKSLELVDGKMKEVEILVDQSGKRINNMSY